MPLTLIKGLESEDFNVNKDLINAYNGYKNSRSNSLQLVEPDINFYNKFIITSIEESKTPIWGMADRVNIK